MRQGSSVPPMAVVVGCRGRKGPGQKCRSLALVQWVSVEAESIYFEQQSHVIFDISGLRDTAWKLGRIFSKDVTA